MEIPFANIAIYNDEFALDEQKADTLKDGNVYGVAPITSADVFNKLSSRSETQTQ